MKVTHNTGGSSVSWTWEDVKFLCPSLSRNECEQALLEATTKMYGKVLPYAWETLELSLSECGYELEGEKCE